MNRIYKIYNRLSQSEALDQSIGIMETKFFEPLYRFTYFTGLSTYERSVTYKVYRYSVLSVTILLMCGELWFLFTESSTLDEITKSFSVFLLQSITQYKFWSVVSNKSLYTELAKAMDSPYFDMSMESRQKIADIWAQRSKNYLKLFWSMGTGSLFSWFLDPLFDDIEYNLVTDTKLPFNYKNPVLYPVTYVLVLITLWYAGYFVIVTGMTMQSHLIHILCQFIILADCFENILEECSVGFEGISTNDLIQNKEFREKFTQRLTHLIKQHQFIIRNTQNLQAVLDKPMLAQLAVSGSLICVMGYQGATTFDQGIIKALVSLIFLAYNVFELYIVCKWAEEITDWNSKLGEAIYCSGWENGLCKIPGVRLSILIVMAHAQKPFYFTAGGMYNLTIDSFAKLMKGSYSVLTVMLGSRSE